MLGQTSVHPTMPSLLFVVHYVEDWLGAYGTMPGAYLLCPQTLAHHRLFGDVIIPSLVPPHAQATARLIHHLHTPVEGAAGRKLLVEVTHGSPAQGGCHRHEQSVLIQVVIGVHDGGGDGVDGALQGASWCMSGDVCGGRAGMGTDRQSHEVEGDLEYLIR